MFVTENLQRLRQSSDGSFQGVPRPEANLRQGFVSTGMGDLQTKMLTLAEARSAKQTWTRRAERLLQAEQPRAIECAD